MKTSILFGGGATGVAVLASAVVLWEGKAPEATVAMGPNGLQSLKVNNTEFLQNGDFKVEHVLLKKPDGTTYAGSTSATPMIDQANHTITCTYPWGKIVASYAANKSRVMINITTTNTSNSETIQSVNYIPLTLKFPDRVKEYDGSIPLLEHNVGQVAGVKVSFGSGTAAVIAEDVVQPLMVGFPWAVNRPTNTIFPLSIHTGRVESYPDSYPTINRAIPPNAADSYAVSIRFGRAKDTEASLESDAYKKFSETFPLKSNWTDRRPIGAVFLASSLPERPLTNPRGWFGDSHLNVMTPAGKTEFQQRVLKMADESVRIMRDMNAQGAITWDPEGQEFAHATSYIGDPRMVDTLAPEMAEVIDEYFARFTKAGFRVGVCVRPQLLRVSSDLRIADQLAAPDPAQLLIDKIAYAKKRWGVSLIYLDSNTNGPKDPTPLDAEVVQKVATQFPDVLIIPEHANLRYYAYSIPYVELRSGRTGTPDFIRAAYPNASSLVYTADGPLDLYRSQLSDGIKKGDVMMYRTWWPDPQNEKVKSLYK